MAREITTHKVNGLNESLEIRALDEPGHGNASHRYGIRSTEQRVLGTAPKAGCFIEFQNGPISEGVNGISNEALLAVVRDRLECFQAGPYACDTNEEALDHVVEAMMALQRRAQDRVARGVEGTHTV